MHQLTRGRRILINPECAPKKCFRVFRKGDDQQKGGTCGDVVEGGLEAVGVDLLVAGVAQDDARPVLVLPADAAALPGRKGPAVGFDQVFFQLCRYISWNITFSLQTPDDDQGL